MKIATLTTTRGDRPQFVRQAVRLLDAQTRQPDVRYLVDTPPTSDRPDSYLRLQQGLQRAIRDHVTHLFFWDDDEYYAPTYIAAMLAHWPETTHVLGISNIVYYHLRMRRWVERDFPIHACMSATAIQVLPFTFYTFPASEPYLVDVALWRAARGAGINAELWQQPGPGEQPLVIGMKHGQGWTTGSHHWPPAEFTHDDSSRSWLEEHIPREHWEFYDIGWIHGNGYQTRGSPAG